MQITRDNGKLPGYKNKKPQYDNVWVNLAETKQDWQDNTRIIGELAEKFLADKKTEEIERRLKQQTSDRPNNANRPLSEHIFKKTAETPWVYPAKMTGKSSCPACGGGITKMILYPSSPSSI